MKTLKLSYFAYAILALIAKAEDPQLAECIQQLCCLAGTEDTSSTCWNSCEQYQGILAESGCHILDPATLHTTSSVMSQPPTSTVTLVGPTNFCQGLSPGGSSCMTISAGCYAISPLWNYMPATTCTGISTISSQLSTSSSLSRSISTSSDLSMSTSSSVSSSSISSPSASSSTASNSGSSSWRSSSVSSASSVSYGSTSTSAKPTTFSTTISRSSSTGGVLPPPTNPAQAATNAVNLSNSASSSANSYQDDPTSPAKAKAAEDAISAALEAARAAASIATDSAALAALTSLVTALESALTAATAAVAAPTIATAASLAASMATVATATTKVNNNAETQTAPTQNSGSTISHTASQTTSQSVSTTSSRLTTTSPPSSTSTGSSTTSSSPSSSSSSACPLCVSCADSTSLEIPSGGDDSVPAKREVLSFFDKRDYLSHQSTRFQKRANTVKEITVCGTSYKSGLYVTAGQGLMSYGYTYRSSSQTCSWNFAFVPGAITTQGGTFETEHVYEAQLILQFANSLGDCASAGLIKNYLARTTAFPGRRSNPWANSGGSALGAMMLAMSDNSVPPELVGLDKNLNGLKMSVFNLATQSFSTPSTAPDKLALVSRMAMLWQYLSTPAIITIFKDTSQRMRAILQMLDNEIAASTVANPGFRFEDRYSGWEDNLLLKQGGLLQNQMESLITAAKDQVANDVRIGSQTLRDNFVTVIEKLTNPGAIADPLQWDDLFSIFEP